MSLPPLLRLDDVSKEFSGTPVLNKINLSIAPGERRGVIGPNGAGKTTLINVITGKYRASGAIYFQGARIDGFEPYRRNNLGIARSFQILSLFREMTIEENLRNAILRHENRHVTPWKRLSRLPGVREKAAHIAATLGLSEVFTTPVDQLTYGMQRRLDIGLVLAQKPKLLILDEPAAGLSAAETRDLISVLKSAIRNCALILVEHDMDVVYALSDIITVLDYGRVVTEGTPPEVNVHPEVRRVYLGEEAA